MEALWDTEFYTPAVLRGTALCAIQRQRCIQFRVLRAQEFYVLLALNGKKGSTSLEAQQRYSSYRTMLDALVSQKNMLCLFSRGIAHISCDMLQDGVWHRCARVKLGTKGGITHLG